MRQTTEIHTQEPGGKDVYGNRLFGPIAYQGPKEVSPQVLVGILDNEASALGLTGELAL
jgi:hypothetical protein